MTVTAKGDAVTVIPAPHFGPTAGGSETSFSFAQCNYVNPRPTGGGGGLRGLPVGFYE